MFHNISINNNASFLLHPYGYFLLFGFHNLLGIGGTCLLLRHQMQRKSHALLQRLNLLDILLLSFAKGTAQAFALQARGKDQSSLQTTM